MAKILIVDDDKNFLLSVADGIEAHEDLFNVATAENGKQALEILKQGKIDLLLTDLQMPEMDGLELAAYMVSDFPHIPVIVMTAFVTREIENRVANMGIFSFLEKPLDFHLLMETIKEGVEVFVAPVANRFQ